MTMAHGVSAVLKRPCKVEGKTGIGSRRIFPPHFKLQVLDSYRNDVDCKGNQRATARKYGIHRRQIQKWLQVENNLRNSVKGKTPSQVVKDAVTLKGNEYGRQLGDNFPPRQLEARVPQMLSPVPEIIVPLDFTTHAREHASPIAGSPVPNFDPAAPMDLSVKRATTGDHVAFTPILQHSPIAQFPSSAYYSNPDAWDLSTKTSKRKSEDCTVNSTVANPKPVKLFKPYLDDLEERSSDDDNKEKCAEIISNCCGYSCNYEYYTNNNNNNNNNNNSSAYDTYTLHELQPKSSLSQYHFYHPVTTTTYIYANPECEVYYPYDEPLQPLKQRQSYSLDFKLSAIECYYQDELCRGNQRAVASKYNIHRRQVQKWLQQEDELRERNVVVKQEHVS